jgi:hypothetical protein
MRVYKVDDEVEYWAADVDPEKYIPGPNTVTSTVVSFDEDTTTRDEPIQWLTLANGDVLRSDYTCENAED